MDQIMRLRRRATSDYGIKDSNAGYGHETAFVNIIEKWGTLHEAQLPIRSLRRGQHDPRADRPERRQAPAGLGRHRSARPMRQGRPAEGASSTTSCRTRRRSSGSSRRSSRRTSGSSSTCTSSARRRAARGGDGAQAEGVTSHEGRLLARLRLARIHARAPRRDGACRAEARHRVGRARPRELLRRRRDRRAQPELADTLNARTFAMAQGVDGAAGMMNICSTCQGAQSECRERLDADEDYRDEVINPHLSRRASTTNRTATGGTRTSSGCSSRRSGSTRCARGSSARWRACASRRSTAATSSAPRAGSATADFPERDTYLEQVIDARRRDGRSPTPAATSAAASP